MHEHKRQYLPNDIESLSVPDLLFLALSLSFQPIENYCFLDSIFYSKNLSNSQLKDAKLSPLREMEKECAKMTNAV